MRNWFLHGLNDFVGSVLFGFIGLNGIMFVTLNGTGMNGYASSLAIGLFFGVGLFIGIIVSGAHGSGHLNPAVSVSSRFFDRDNQAPKSYLPGLILAQFLGFVVAMLVVMMQYYGNPVLVQTNFGAPGPGSGYTGLSVLAGEAIGSLIFFLVITTVVNLKVGTIATAATIATALTVMVTIYATQSGGSFNPARGLVPMLFATLLGGAHYDLTTWLSIGLTPFVMALVAAPLGKLLAQAVDPRTAQQLSE